MNMTNNTKRAVVLVRHGSTHLNDNGDKIRGWSNIQLNENGIKQAEEVGNQLRGKDIYGIITSDLLRAQQTAHIISQKSGIKVIGFTPMFRPWNVGDFTGVESSIAIPKLVEYINNPEKPVPGGESFNKFKERFYLGLTRIINEFKDKKIAIVAHHRNDRLLDAWIKDKGDDYGVDMEKFLTKGIPPGSWKEYYV